MTARDTPYGEVLKHAVDSQLAHTATLIDAAVSQYAPLDSGGDGTREALIRARNYLRLSVKSCSMADQAGEASSSNIQGAIACGALSSTTSERKIVLEEAAGVCEEYKCDHPGGMIVAGVLARKIRAL